MPILLYGSEVWEAYDYSPTKQSDEWGKLTIEAIQTQFIRRLIGVNKSITNTMVHGAIGRYLLTMFIKLKTLKFVKTYQIYYEYENSLLNSNTEIGQRRNKIMLLLIRHRETNLL